ncbi:unnamed protein product, partial [Staurois parvus]
MIPYCRGGPMSCQSAPDPIPLVLNCIVAHSWLEFHIRFLFLS